MATKLEALTESIAHWKRVLIGKDKWAGADDCALCKEFNPTGLCLCCDCPLLEYDMWCGANPSPYREFYESKTGLIVPPPNKRSRRLQSAIVNMLTALLFVREAVRSEGGK